MAVVQKKNQERNKNGVAEKMTCTFFFTLSATGVVEHAAPGKSHKGASSISDALPFNATLGFPAVHLCSVPTLHFDLLPCQAQDFCWRANFTTFFVPLAKNKCFLILRPRFCFCYSTRAVVKYGRQGVRTLQSQTRDLSPSLFPTVPRCASFYSSSTAGLMLEPLIARAELVCFPVSRLIFMFGLPALRTHTVRWDAADYHKATVREP